MPAALQCAEQQPLTAHHGCERETGLRGPYGQQGAGRIRPARHRDEEGAAQGSQGSGQHYWCCLASASDRGAGLVVAVVVEQ